MAAEPVAAEPAAEAEPPVEAPTEVAPPKAAKQPKPPKPPKPDKKKGKDKDAKATPAGDGPSIAAHPRAARGVARAKSWGGLLGFLVTGYLALPTNTVAGAGLRALIAGVVCYVAAWAGAVFVWRRLVVLEIKGREQQLIEAAIAAAEPAQRPQQQRPSARAGG